MKKLFLMFVGSLLGIAGATAAVPDLSKVRYTVGEGTNNYLLVMRFNVKDRIDNFVYGVKSDNANLSSMDALHLIADVDKRLQVQVGLGGLSVSFDLNGDSKIDNADIQGVEVMDFDGNSLLAADGITPVLTLQRTVIMLQKVITSSIFPIRRLKVYGSRRK
ncbi:MAG: hypothetical protein K2K77_09035 [Duncaniella sp.]|nr:hypothetical protein [Duncaniella sp.]